MLTFSQSTRCGRREFLRVGGLTLGGLSLASSLQVQQATANSASILKDRSVIFLFLHGGPSQTETFDPKMTAPSNVRSATGELATSLPGITFGGTFPRLAALADRLTIVRSFVTGDGNHDIKPVVSRETFGASLGSIYARVAGSNHPLTGVPRNALLYPRAVDSSTQKEELSFGDFSSTGRLGSGCAPVILGAGGGFQDDLNLQLPMTRVDDRRQLLRQLDDLHRQRDRASIRMDTLREQALETLLGKASEAFNLQAEDAQVVERYDTGPLVRPDQIDPKWKNYHNYVDNAKSLGKLLLLARRLCERGCGFVTVTTNFVWDMHADINNAPVGEGMRYMGLPLDHALSAFIEDCDNRGLQEKILLVVCGEMGRTPRINDAGGRDHWGDLAPLLLYGGGLSRGQVLGQSDREAGRPASDPVTLRHLIGTLLHTSFDVGRLRLLPDLPREISSLLAYDPIPGLS
jgi:hypothetical protein